MLGESIEHHVKEEHDEMFPKARKAKVDLAGLGAQIVQRKKELHSASETSEVYLILANDDEEIWFIANKHVRAYGLFPGSTQLRFPADGAARAQPLRVARGD